MGQNGAIYIVTPGVAPWSSEVLPVDVDQPSSINDRPTVAVGELIADATGDEILVGDEVGRLVLLTSTQSLIFADGFESGDTGAWKLR